MEEEKQKTNIVNHFEKDSNCQVFNGPVSGCVFAMPGAVVKQYTGTQEPLQEGQAPSQEVPEQLRTQEATAMMQRLVSEGLLGEDWQPCNLSGSERGLVARAVGERLGIDEVWKVFGALWGEKSQTLRSYHSKALDMRKSLKFQDRLKDILG